MDEDTKFLEVYRETMRGALLRDPLATHCALTHHPEGSPARRFAEALLVEAGWTAREFHAAALEELKGA